MLEGEVDYRHGDEVYPLKPGDSLFFDADSPHGPETLVKLPAQISVCDILSATLNYCAVAQEYVRRSDAYS